MIYGLYLSATGVLANTYRQDVIANNIANSETIGFKRDLALLQQRPTAAQEGGDAGAMFDPTTGNMPGGMLATPTLVDTSQGDMQPTGNPLDVAIEGEGYFAVNANGQMRLTRNGQFVMDSQGRLALFDGNGPDVLDNKQSPIYLQPGSPVTISGDGTVSQNGSAVARLGVFNVPDPADLKKEGNTLMSVQQGAAVNSVDPTLRDQFLERSNVDPATELTTLMDAQRQLEANANMIRTQDETLDKLISDVGKVS
ncbi:MAG: flagellar hook-basal body protein [Tepidisphaeraceae bacterium]